MKNFGKHILGILELLLLAVLQKINEVQVWACRGSATGEWRLPTGEYSFGVGQRPLVLFFFFSQIFVFLIFEILLSRCGLWWILFLIFEFWKQGNKKTKNKMRKIFF